MKKIILLLCMLIASYTGYSQAVKKHCTYIATSSYSYTYSKWLPYSDWEKIDGVVLFVMRDDYQISIYTRQMQTYDLVYFVEEDSDYECNWSVWKAINEDGTRCLIKLLIYNSGEIHFYVIFNDYRFAYLLE